MNSRQSPPIHHPFTNFAPRFERPKLRPQPMRRKYAQHQQQHDTQQIMTHPTPKKIGGLFAAALLATGVMPSHAGDTFSTSDSKASVMGTSPESNSSRL
jgi:hypothetical protein